MNNEQYKEALRHAQQLENKIRDLLDDKAHPLGQSLMNDSRRIVDELENKKNPRSIEDRVKSMITLLHHVDQHGEQIMDHRHTAMLHKDYEHLMMSFRKFDNY